MNDSLTHPLTGVGARRCYRILLALSVSIKLVPSSARVTSVKSQQGGSVTDGHLDPKIGPQVYLGPINILDEQKSLQTLN